MEKLNFCLSGFSKHNIVEFLVQSQSQDKKQDITRFKQDIKLCALSQ